MSQFIQSWLFNQSCHQYYLEYPSFPNTQSSPYSLHAWFFNKPFKTLCDGSVCYLSVYIEDTFERCVDHSQNPFPKVSPYWVCNPLKGLWVISETFWGFERFSGLEREHWNTGNLFETLFRTFPPNIFLKREMTAGSNRKQTSTKSSSLQTLSLSVVWWVCNLLIELFPTVS